MINAQLAQGIVSNTSSISEIYRRGYLLMPRNERLAQRNNHAEFLKCLNLTPQL